MTVSNDIPASAWEIATALAALASRQAVLANRQAGLLDALSARLAPKTEAPPKITGGRVIIGTRQESDRREAEIFFGELPEGDFNAELTEAARAAHAALQQLRHPEVSDEALCAVVQKVVAATGNPAAIRMLRSKYLPPGGQSIRQIPPQNRAAFIADLKTIPIIAEPDPWIAKLRNVRGVTMSGQARVHMTTLAAYLGVPGATGDRKRIRRVMERLGWQYLPQVYADGFFFIGFQRKADG